jgi:hypothetical protein
MRRLVIVLTILTFAAMSPNVFAQSDYDHGEAGAYVDYLRLNQAGNTNFVGLGGRIAFNVASRVQLEGQMTYDFQKSFSSISSSTLNVTVQNSNLTLWHGLFGPKFLLAGDHAQFFGTVQGGFIRFGVAAGSEANSFSNSVSNFGDSATHGAMYPGVGGALYWGPVGIRLDVGDFIYWNNGAQNNLSIKVGPQFRF